MILLLWKQKMKLEFIDNCFIEMVRDARSDNWTMALLEYGEVYDSVQR